MNNVVLILFLFGVLFGSTFSLNDAYAAIDSPTATASFDDGDSDGSGGTFDQLDRPEGITTVVIGDNTYALVASYGNKGVQIIDITTPGSPTVTASIHGDADPRIFYELVGPHDITTVVIGDNTYALVASSHMRASMGVQIIDITTPGSPTATASFDDGDSDGSGGTFDELTGARGITTVVIGSNTYALVASDRDDGVQIIDITTPGSPTATASFGDGDSDGSGGTFDELDGAWAITTVVIGDNTYALVAANADDGVQIIDITTPGSPTATASFDDGDLDGSGGTFSDLDGPRGITTVVIGDNTYALVASYDSDGVQIIDITTPGSPTATASFTSGTTDASGGTFDELDGASGITTVVIGSNTYALVAANADDGVEIIDITTPGSPTVTASFDDGDLDGSGGTFDELKGAYGITTVVIDSKIYALVASNECAGNLGGCSTGDDDGVQIIELDVVPADSTSSSDCYDCEPPKLRQAQIQIASAQKIIATDDEPLHVTANVGDKVTILLNVTDNISVDTIPFAGLYTNYQEKPNDMNTFYANNYDKWKHVSTSFYEWNVRSDDVAYDYGGTITWGDNAPTVVTGEITEDNFKFKNEDHNTVEYLMMPFTFTMNDSMETTQIIAKIYDASGNMLYETLPVTLEIIPKETVILLDDQEVAILDKGDVIVTPSEDTAPLLNEPVLLTVLSQWSGYSQVISDDAELLSSLGLQGDSLPSWTKNLGEWVIQEKLDVSELIMAINYVHDNQ